MDIYRESRQSLKDWAVEGRVAQSCDFSWCFYRNRWERIVQLVHFSNQTTGNDFTIRLTSTANETLTDTSDGEFTVAQLGWDSE